MEEQGRGGRLMEERSEVRKEKGQWGERKKERNGHLMQNRGKKRKKDSKSGNKLKKRQEGYGGMEQRERERG